MTLAFVALSSVWPENLMVIMLFSAAAALLEQQPLLLLVAVADDAVAVAVACGEEIGEWTTHAHEDDVNSCCWEELLLLMWEGELQLLTVDKGPLLSLSLIHI